MAWSTRETLTCNPKFYIISWDFSPSKPNSLQCFNKTSVSWNGLISVHFEWPSGSHTGRNCTLQDGDQLHFSPESVGMCSCAHCAQVHCHLTYLMAGCSGNPEAASVKKIHKAA